MRGKRRLGSNMKSRTGVWLVALVAALGFAATAQAQTRVENDHPSVRYEGSWQTIANPAVTGGTIAASNVAGAKAHITFNGPDITWIGYECPCAGRARMYIDGVLYGTRDPYNRNHVPYTTMYVFSNLGEGQHVLTIEVTGERDARSTNTYIGVDAFDIGPPDAELPEVTLTSPADGDLVTGMVTISAEASDNLGVAAVYFSTSQGLSLGVDREPPYSITVDASRVPHGTTHVIRATAVDTRNAATDSVSVTVFQNGVTDVTPPYVEMSAPENGALVTGLVTLSAEGYDNVGITRVEFLTQDDVVIGTATSAPWSITRDTSNLPTGSRYFIRARAYDAAGLSFTSTYSISVTVQHEDPVRPTVSLTAPASGATVSGTVALTADAADNVGVSEVEFWSGYSRVGYDTTAPYTGLFDTLPLRDGATTLAAEAVDANRNRTRSALVSFNIDNHIQPGMTRVDDAASALIYSGAWETYATLPMFGDISRFHWASGHLSRQVGANVTFAFEGVRVRLLAAKCYSCGNPTITIDGGTPQQINLGNDFLLSEGVSMVVWESPLLAAGAHTVQLTVQTNAYGGSDVLIDGFEVLNVNDTAAPAVALTSPVGGDVLSGMAVFEATASDDTGVTKVLFYAGGWLIGEDTTAPYSISWDTRSQPFDSLDLKAVAYDSIGRRTESSTVRVGVNN
jgi:hypothetical protein